MWSRGVTMLIFAAICLVTGSGKSQARKQSQRLDREWRAIQRNCEQGPCRNEHPDTAENCVNQCTSKLCYGEVYASDPVSEDDLLESASYVNSLIAARLVHLI